MQRRSAIKNLALTIGGTIVLPAWANAWSKESLQNNTFKISYSQEALLAEIVETIIPKTDTPGAKELGADKFILKMVADCYDKKSQDVFAKGLVSVDELSKKENGKTFVESDSTQKLNTLKKMSTSQNSDDKGFIQLVKGLTIDGYLVSEYVMTNLRIFEMVPGRFHGCVPIKK
ncbi:gluconate 2-dehydrogenase subunit 3 family protein [Arcicella aquatica]|uniref:Gluconate 2-dehydrogenase subunit 3 family protein n=1 Tax=Arcicella aquatica TaxID=217141 RepID=A0ABU5QR84_9BACT|nr:gluconate 2-dehydrogenase subunit 3 family protein [Arcicella aquatica]MEA5259598.1 gluconate 2-dehydrogenase subunit 3 family protein [Arcicella aquatica]